MFIYDKQHMTTEKNSSILDFDNFPNSQPLINN